MQQTKPQQNTSTPVLGWFDGQPLETYGQELIQALLTSRSLAYGESLFETMRLIEGQVPLWPLHQARLLMGAQAWGYSILPEHMAAIEQQVMAFSQQAPHAGILKLSLLRLEAAAGYAQSTQIPWHVWLQKRAFVPEPTPYQQGIQAGISEYLLPQMHTPLTGAKHGNRAHQILARQTWPPLWQEALLIDQAGYLLEANSRNLFWWSQGRLYSPQITSDAVHGVFSRYLVQQGYAPIYVRQRWPVLAQADSLFVANSVQGIWPVASLQTPEGQYCYANDDAPTRQLMRDLHPKLGLPS